jgi:dienelactone hydrolase
MTGGRDTPLKEGASMTTVTIPTPTGQMAAYLAVPVGDPPWPGVLVIHDALGMTSGAPTTKHDAASQC